MHLNHKDRACVRDAFQESIRELGGCGRGMGAGGSFAPQKIAHLKRVKLVLRSPGSIKGAEQSAAACVYASASIAASVSVSTSLSTSACVCIYTSTYICIDV